MTAVETIKDLAVGDRVHFPDGLWAQRMDMDEFDEMTNYTSREIQNGMIPFTGISPNGVPVFYLLPGDNPATLNEGEL